MDGSLLEGDLMHVMTCARTLRRALIVIGILSLVEATGLVMQLPPFSAIWLLGGVSQVDLYLGAYMAAIGASLLWVGVSGELGATVAGAIALTVTYTSLGLSLIVLSRGTDQHLAAAALLCGVAAVAAAGVALWFRRFP